MRTTNAMVKGQKGAVERSQLWVRGVEDRQPNITENVLAIFQPDVLIPSQFLDTQRSRSYLEPERVLMSAILRDAVACYQEHVGATCKRKKALYTNAEEWFFADDPSYAFSFVNVCDALGLEPDYLRAGLRRWMEVALGANDQPLVGGMRASRASQSREAASFDAAQQSADLPAS